MNYFQVTFDNNAGYNTSHLHEAITGSATIQDWWHYLSNAYIIETNSSLLYQSNRIREAFPRLNFLIIKVDTKEFNGFLKKEAWEWLRKRNQLRIKYTSPERVKLRSQGGMKLEDLFTKRDSLPSIDESPISKALEILKRNNNS